MFETLCLSPLGSVTLRSSCIWSDWLLSAQCNLSLFIYFITRKFCAKARIRCHVTYGRLYI